MSKLIKLQLRTLFHQKLFYICLGLLIIMPTLLNYALSIYAKGFGDYQVFPQISSFLAGEIGIVGIVFVALFSCFELNEGTAKNIIARGYTRKQLLFSTYITTFIGLVALYSLVSVITFFLFLKNGIGYDSSMLYPFIVSIASIICFMFFYSTISVIIQKSGFAVVTCLLAPVIIATALGFVDYILKIDISQYWFGNFYSNFTDKPTLANLGYMVLGYAIYTAVFIVAGIQILNKKEIK